MNSYKATLDFPFEKIILASPISLQGDTYFSKMTIDGKPILIQLPKTSTKNTISSIKRECSTDLLYTINQEKELTEWVETLEKTCTDKINEKKSLWFTSSFKRSDIEGLLTPISRPYRGDKILIIRISIDSTKNPSCQMYDDMGNKLDDSTSISTNNSIIPLVHLEGINFSSKSIDIILVLSQVMVFSPEKKNIECLINNENKKISDTSQIIKQQLTDQTLIKTPVSEDISSLEKNNLYKIELDKSTEIYNVNLGELIEIPSNDNELREIDITDTNENSCIILKKPNDIYYELYRIAKDKAILAKQLAVDAYLEANQIKKKFNINDPDE